MKNERIVTFDAIEWRDKTNHLTPLQKSVLLDLLCHKWIDGMLPMSLQDMARLASTSPQHLGQSRKKLDPLLEYEWLK